MKKFIFGLILLLSSVLHAEEKKDDMNIYTICINGYEWIVFENKLTIGFDEIVIRDVEQVFINNIRHLNIPKECSYTGKLKI